MLRRRSIDKMIGVEALRVYIDGDKYMEEYAQREIEQCKIHNLSVKILMAKLPNADRNGQKGKPMFLPEEQTGGRI